MMPSERTTLTLQGGYYVITGVAPFVSRRAFEAVTGPKTEWWLVQTVGAIVTVVGATLLSGARSGRVTPELRLLAAGCAASLAGIDIVYVAQRRIAPSYLLDAAAQFAILTPLLVTAAVAELVRRGTIERRADGSWVLLDLTPPDAP